MSRTIEIEQDKGKKKLLVNFLSSCLYDNSTEETTITLSYDPKLKPYYLHLGEHFTKYYLDNI